MFIINAKRWFENTNGNTYHSVEVYNNNKLLHKEPMAYGYGDHYLQTALDILKEHSLIHKHTISNYSKLMQDMYKNPDNYLVLCSDVTRKKDL